MGELGFLFKKLSLPKSNLNILLQCEEFVNVVNRMVVEGEEINDLCIYNVVKDLYFPMLKDFNTEGFKAKYKEKYGTAKYKEWSYKFATYGDAVKRFSKSIFDNSDHWKEDFVVFCNH